MGLEPICWVKDPIMARSSLGVCSELPRSPEAAPTYFVINTKKAHNKCELLLIFISYYLLPPNILRRNKKIFKKSRYNDNAPMMANFLVSPSSILAPLSSIPSPILFSF